MSEREVTAEEFSEWKSHPVTRAFFATLKDQRDALAGQILSGRFLGTGADQDRAVIAVEIYDEVLNTEYEDTHE